MAALGLRGKSLLALLLTCLLALTVAGVIGHQVLDGMQSRFGEAYARNLVQLNRERMFAPVSRELALAQRLAGSQLTLAWLKDEQNPQQRELFFREAAGFQQSFDGQLYFAASAQSNGYYGNGPSQPASQQASRPVISWSRPIPATNGSSRRSHPIRPISSTSTAPP